MTAIRDVDLSQPLPRLDDLGDADACMVILRWRRRVVGRFTVPVRLGAIEQDRLASLVRARVPREALDCWLDEFVGFDDRHGVAPEPLTAAVAICTRERPADVASALGAIAELRPRPSAVVVVDNAPATSRTREVVARYPGVRYVLEPRRGLDAARNAALRSVQTDVVAFTDDDALPEPEWLQALLANFQDPRVICATGLTLPLELQTEAQEQFEQHCSFVRGFRRRVFDGQHANPLHVGPVGAGANMAVRRDAALRLGGFDERLDGGMPTRAGGDHDFFSRGLAAGHRIVYDPAAVSRHRHRRTMSELVDTVHGYGVGVYAMWTGLLIERREIGVLRVAWEWLRSSQLPAMFGRGAPAAVSLTRNEIRGCIRGPRMWFAARRLRRREAEG
jgi:GT2 family glycosyltransferase